MFDFVSVQSEAVSPSTLIHIDRSMSYTVHVCRDQSQVGSLSSAEMVLNLYSVFEECALYQFQWISRSMGETVQFGLVMFFEQA